MKRNNLRALSLAAAIVLCGALLASFAVPVNAQDPPATDPQTSKVIKTRFVVVHMLYQSLQVRTSDDSHDLRTFTYAPAIRDEMQNILNAGGYQYGDRVTVWYKRGENVAIRIKGKPSKPS
jgi:hypothetical protein